MKKYTLILLSLSIAGIFTTRTGICSGVHPSNGVKKTKVLHQATDTSTALKIGDKVPDPTLNNLINYPKSSIKLSDFKGKLLILDFWATWCSPCVAMIPKMETLQKQFGNKIQFLPVAYQARPVVEAFLSNLERRDHLSQTLPELTDDQTLIKLFPHTYLPHYVWIDGNGTVKAITGFEEVNAENIAAILSSQAPVLQAKNDEQQLSYNKEKPLFIANNGGNGQTLIYHSLISGYTAGIGSGYHFTSDSINGLKLTCRNQTIPNLYRIAYGDEAFFGGSRTLVMVKDTSKLNTALSGAAYTEWMRQGNAFCYELTLPPGLASRFNTIMREDLDRFFIQYEIGLEKRKVKCLALVRTSDADKIHTSGGQYSSSFSPFGFTMHNFNLGRLIAQLNFIYLQKSPLPIVDATNYKGYVDMTVKASLNNVESINTGLKPYDLELKETEMDLDVLVIKDRTGNDNVNQLKP